jgi:predicted alpha/beta hydrolase
MGTRQWLWASTGPSAMSSQASWWSPQNSCERKKKFKEKTPAGTGSGYEQARGHQLRAYILTMKLMVISKLTWEKKNYMEKATTGTGSGYEQAQGHEQWAHMLTFKLFGCSKLNWKK